MRIGILTFHRGNNYGGVLQCYALQQVLKSLGHTVEIIDYHARNNRGFLCKLYSKYSTANSIMEILQALVGLVIRSNSLPFDKNLNDASVRVFDEFRAKYLRLSESVDYSTIGEYSNTHYDMIITGSDQVWTSLFESPMVYMIDWIPQFRGKRMSYAACSAHKRLRGRQREIIKHCLDKYDLITVRDHTTQTLVRNINNITPQIVPDPSLLYSFEEFKNETEYEPYILTYILGDEIVGGHELALKKIKRQVGNLPVYAIVIPCNSQDVVKFADKVFETLSPKEWVNLFYHACYVYTDSFHAIMFSLKFEKPFVAYYRNKIRSSRLKDLKKVGINTIYSCAEEICDVPQVYGEWLLKDDFNISDLIERL